MPSLTTTELTLLGLLAEQPRHGYELEEVISERGMREWTEIGFSSIYYVLGKLRHRGLVTEMGGSRSGPTARKVYGATPEGHAECARATEAMLSQVHAVFPALLVALANQPAITPDRLDTALKLRATALAERVEAVHEAADAHKDAPKFVRAIFDYSIGQLTAEQAWLTNYRTETREERGLCPPTTSNES